MKNIYWYIGLAVLGIGSAIFTVYKNRRRYKVSNLIAFYLFMAGFVWICEFLVLGLFNSYSYKTGLFENIWAQNLLGHLLLNTTLYPSAAIISALSKRRSLTLVFLVVFFTVTEYIFLKLDLYVHHWWRYYMTVITVVISMRLATKWFDKLQNGCHGFARAATFFFIALLIVHFPAPILLLLGKQYYQLNIINNYFDDLYQSSIIFIFSYHLLESIVLVLITCIFKKHYLKILPFIISVIAQCIFLSLNLLIVKDDWHIASTLILYEVFIGVFLMIEKKTLKPV